MYEYATWMMISSQVVQGCKLRSYQYCDQNTAVQEAARALHSTRPKVVVGFEVMELCTDQRNVKALLRVNVKVIEDTGRQGTKPSRPDNNNRRA